MSSPASDLAARLATLAGIANALPVGIVYYSGHDDARRCLFANDAALAFFSITRQVVLGAMVQSIIGRADYALVVAHFDRAYSGKVAFYEREVLRPDGPSKWLDFALIPDLDPSTEAAGQPGVRGVYVFIADVTARHVQAVAIAEKKRHVQLALMAARMTTWSWDIQTGQLHFDEGAESLLAAARLSDVRSVQDLIDMVHPEDRERQRYLLARALKGEGSYELEHRIRGIDGSWLWMQSRGQVVEADSSAVVTAQGTRARAQRMMGVSYDISERKRAELERERAEVQVRAISNNMPGILIQVGTDWICRYQNDAHFNTFRHLSPVPGMGRHLRDIIGLENFEIVRPHYEKAFAGGESELLRVVEVPGAGSLYAQMRVIPSKNAAGLIDGAYSLAIDVTESHRAELAIAESEARFRALTALSSDWYWEIDAQYRFTRYEAASPDDVLPIPVKSVIGLQRWELGGTILYPESWAMHHAQLDRRELFRDLLLRNRNQRGDVIYASVSGEPVFDAKGNFFGYRGIGRNVSERFRNEEKIAYLAYHDVLTDLPNRTLVQDRIAQAVAHAQRTGQSLAVLFIDLDNFKSINDSMGHAAGDQVLVEAASRLRRELRAEDTMGRFGGDEFIALLPTLESASDAGAVADKLISGLCLPMQIGQQELSLTCSVGIALFPDDGADEGTLTRNADAAMYHAKETGRNTFRYFTSSLNAHATRRLSLENDLKRGIERGEFTLVYQPQIAIASGKVAGVEALVRWNRSGYGDVTPSEFIPLCENIGVIATLGRWVLEQALAQMRRWIDAGVAPPRMAVNVSAKQLHDPEFAQHVANAMVDAGVDATRLELEITETAALEHRSEIVLTIDQLRRLGVRFCLDDFGTGYSSLAYLKRFPVDVIKIDRSFVSEVHKNNGGAAVVKAVLALARGLDIGVVAEGVELAEQAAILRALDCPVAQGFYHSKPLSAAACADFLRERGVAL